MMKTLLLLLLGIVATQAKEERSWVYEVRAWAEPNFQGDYRDFNQPVPYLDSYDFDNTIASVRVKGVWIFYDLPEYNTYAPSLVHYDWGLDHKETFPVAMQNKASSLRPVGNLLTMNEEGYNLYEGTLYTKKELYETNDIPDLTDFHQEVTSIIIIGRSSWTFCENTHYQGHCACLHPTEHDENFYDRLDVGFYPNIHDSHYLFQVRSVKKGCYSA